MKYIKQTNTRKRSKKALTKKKKKKNQKNRDYAVHGFIQIFFHGELSSLFFFQTQK